MSQTLHEIELDFKKEHIALDRSSWSMKSVWKRLLWNQYGSKDVLNVVMILTNMPRNYMIFPFHNAK